MRVMLNTSIPASLNFKATAKGNDFRFNREQEIVAENIVNELRTPKSEFGNKTAEDFYMLNHDLDFLIFPAYTRYDSVELYGTHLIRHEDGSLSWQKSSNFIIGTYNAQNTQESDNKILQDVEKARIEEPKKTLNNKILAFLALAVVLYGSVFVIGSAKRTTPESKALIENADSLLKKTDTITSDTAKFSKYAGQ